MSNLLVSQGGGNIYQESIPPLSFSSQKQLHSCVDEIALASTEAFFFPFFPILLVHCDCAVK